MCGGGDASGPSSISQPAAFTYKMPSCADLTQRPKRVTLSPKQSVVSHQRVRAGDPGLTFVAGALRNLARGDSVQLRALASADLSGQLQAVPKRGAR